MPIGQKFTIYQMLPRLFGNQTSHPQAHGSMQVNGVGKFNDISAKALREIRKLGITHVWFTGVIEHATMTDFSEFGIKPDHPWTVKGQAGSPYAIKDYFDVAPDLAESVPDRMEEFEDLVARTHKAGMKVIIDFVPNHVARSYRSDQVPEGIKDLGKDDNPHAGFAPHNNFLYLPNEELKLPEGYEPFGPKGIKEPAVAYREVPAKVSGDDVFSPKPSINNWFETVKLNYGIDFTRDWRNHFNPPPDTWMKMKEIVRFWAQKGVDGFRCDMVHMVPIPFWNWMISQLKEEFPDLIFIGEIYEPSRYPAYIFEGGFDYLYDKVGLYDHLRLVMNVEESTRNIHKPLRETEYVKEHMLHFLENHDEQRIASPEFAGDMQKGIPAMTVSATHSRGPVMIYFGQEVGEPAAGEAGFSGDDGRTTLFDYYTVPELQKWFNGGKCNQTKLSKPQRALRKFYTQLLNLCTNSEAIREGHFYELPAADIETDHTHMIYSYLRHTKNQQLYIIANFDPINSIEVPIFIPEHAWQTMEMNAWDQYQLKELLEGEEEMPLAGESKVEMPPLSARIFELVKE